MLLVQELCDWNGGRPEIGACHCKNDVGQVEASPATLEPPAAPGRDWCHIVCKCGINYIYPQSDWQKLAFECWSCQSNQTRVFRGPFDTLAELDAVAARNHDPSEARLLWFRVICECGRLCFATMPKYKGMSFRCWACNSTRAAAVRGPYHQLATSGAS